MKIVLIIAYISMQGVPSIKVHDMPDRDTCNKMAKEVFKQVKAGSVRAWCHNVINVKGN